ncbi:hypothetical protein [Streptomyces eurythermus]|uniref:hypothetical protein n=1 Tax=Streptomyces eurythermus TaxID=42237 RepID=UPI0036D25E04
MRNRFWTTMALAAIGVTLASAVPAMASENTAAGTVPWSVSLGTASAAGNRWTETRSTGYGQDLVLNGKLTNTGAGCYSLWAQYWHDFSGTPAAKQVEICGPGTVDVNVRHRYDYMTTGQITICMGTTNTTDCAPWVDVTWWPIGTS